jgi:beta-phosphoglucomutase
MDGVLIDSYQAHFESWQQVAAEQGRVYTEGQFAAGFGRTSREVIAEQWRGESLSDDQIAQIDRRKEWLFREIIDRNFPAMDGAVDLIESLVRDGFRVAVGSSGPPENVHLAIERLGVGRLLSATVTGADVKRGKPDPQVFLTAAERMGVPPGRCVVVEDAPVGIEAARRGGIARDWRRQHGSQRGTAPCGDPRREVAPRTLDGALRGGAAGRRGSERPGGMIAAADPGRTRQKDLRSGWQCAGDARMMGATSGEIDHVAGC